MAAKPVRQRSAGSDFAFSLGLVTLKADLVPAKQTGSDAESQFNTLCNDCPTPTKPNQVYVCPNDATHGPYKMGELTRRGKEVDGTLVEVTAEELAAVKTGDVAEKAFAISIFPADQVDKVTLPGDAVYRIRPRKDASPAEYKTYGLLRELAADPTKALLGEFILKSGSTPKMGRLLVFNGQIVLQTLIRPSDLAPTDSIDDVPLSEKEQALATTLANSLIEDFDPATWTNKVRERAKALLAAKADGNDAAVAAATTVAEPTTTDLADLLGAMLENAQAA